MSASQGVGARERCEASAIQEDLAEADVGVGCVGGQERVQLLGELVAVVAVALAEQ
jgi:hypothetical protein